MQLLRSQLNELYDLIDESKKFSPSQFTLKGEGEGFQLEGTRFYFSIYEESDYSSTTVVRFSPGETSFTEGYSGVGWGGIKECFFNWLHFLHREVTSPDKWGRLYEEMQNLVGVNQSNDSSFSHAEYLDISNNFVFIKSSIIEIPLLPIQIEAINNKLDNLLELTSKLNKFDWQNLFIGTIISIVIQLSVTPENAELLYALLKSTFHGLFLQ